jgi:hypothetical protein
MYAREGFKIPSVREDRVKTRIVVYVIWGNVIFHSRISTHVSISHDAAIRDEG